MRMGALLFSLLLMTCAVQAQQHTITYVYTDSQDTPLAEADTDGNIIAQYDYMPYGVSVQSMGPAPNGPGYTGHVYDPDTGLVYMQARYYDPAVGRFLSVDPMRPNPGNTFGFNRYTYANNNPVNLSDPDGRQAAERWVEAHRKAMEAGDGAQFEPLQKPAVMITTAMLAMTPLVGPISARLVRSTWRNANDPSRGFAQARRYVESLADNMRTTGGRAARRTTEFDGRGGGEGAMKMFDRLTRGMSTPRDGGRLGRLSDHSTIFMSSRITQNGTKITSVRISRKRTGSHLRDNIKIRFEER